MDKIESLGNQLSQITMYDIKSMYNQVRLRFGRHERARAMFTICHTGEEYGLERVGDGGKSEGGNER